MQLAARRTRVTVRKGKTRVVVSSEFSWPAVRRFSLLVLDALGVAFFQRSRYECVFHAVRRHLDLVGLSAVTNSENQVDDLRCQKRQSGRQPCDERDLYGVIHRRGGIVACALRTARLCFISPMSPLTSLTSPFTSFTSLRKPVISPFRSARSRSAVSFTNPMSARICTLSDW